MVSCEFLLRNLSFGINYSKKFGCDNFIGYLSDTFGHSVAIPEILKTVNIKNAMLWRGLGNLSSEFLWNGVAVTYLIQGYFQDIFSLELDYDKKTELLTSFIDKIAQRSSKNILLPCGADHLKVADNLRGQVKEINKRLKDYEIVISSPFEYLEAVKTVDRKEVFGEFLDESKNFLLKGVYSSRIYQKQQNAEIQWRMSRICEPFATMASFLVGSKNWQSEIDYAYKEAIKNHAHDSIYGCSIDNVHKDVDYRFRNISQIINGIEKRVVRDLTKNTDKLTIMNLSNFNYSGVVEVETEKELNPEYRAQLISKRKGFVDKKLFDSTQIPITEDITNIKKYLVEVSNVEPFSNKEASKKIITTHKITDKSIENDYIALKIVNKQIILEDKKTSKIYKNFIEIIDRADIGDSYNFGALVGDKKVKAVLLSSKMLKQGQIKSTLRLIYEIKIPYLYSVSTQKRSYYAKHKIFVDVSISNLQKYLEFDLKWENKSKNHILQVKFNLENDVETTYSEDTVGIVKRSFDSKYDIYKHIPAQRGVELKTNTAPMQRFVWAQGFGLVTKGLNEYEVNKKSLNLTILRSTELISEPKNPCRGTPAGPPLYCKGLQCLGENTAQFCVSFEENAQDLYEIAEAFYGCVVPYFSDKKINAFLGINNKNIFMQAIKLDKENNVVLRLVNVSNEKVQINIYPPQKTKKMYLVTANEEIIKEISEEIAFAPREILTIKCTK